MFSFTFKRAEEFHQILAAIRLFSGMANLKCTRNEICLVALTDSNVALVSFILKAPGLLDFKCDSDSAQTINVASILKMMKCANIDDKLQITVAESGKHLQLSFESNNQRPSFVITSKFIQDDNEKLEPVESENWFFAAKLKAEVYAEIINCLTKVGETVSFSSTADVIEMKTSGFMDGAVKLKLHQDVSLQNGILALEIKEIFAPVIYSLWYMTLCAKAATFSSTVVVKILDEGTFLLEQEFENKKGHVRFNISPIVEYINDP